MESEFTDYLKEEAERWQSRYITLRAKKKFILKRNRELVLKVKELNSHIDYLASKERERELKRINKN